MAIRLRIRELLEDKERRENRKITYKVMVAETGLVDATISAYLNNTITRFDRVVLKTWVDYLGVSVGDLFVDEPDP